MNPSNSALDLLRQPLFRRLWATVEMSFLGMFIHMVACGWIMLSMTSSATLVSLIQTAYSLPIVLFSVLAGAMADTLDRRRTMLASLGLSLAGSACLVLFAWLDMLSPWAILGLMFVVGSGTAIFTPSWQASLGEIVSRERLAEAVALHNMGANLMRTLGPSLGGLLISTVTPVMTFAIGTATFIPAIFTLTAWRPAPAPRNDLTEPLGTAMASGLRFVLVTRQVQTLLLRAFLFSAAGVSIMSLLPLVTQQQLGLGAGSYGFLFGCFGAGAIIGGIATGYLRNRVTPERIVRAAICANTAAILLLAVSGSIWPAALACLIGGACWLSVHSRQNSALQLATPRWIVGRMVAMFLSSAFLGLSLGAWIWGVIAENWGTAAALAASAITMVATLLLALRWPMPKVPEISLDALEERRGLVELPDFDPQTGPLKVQIEHRRAAGTNERFHEVMEHRRLHLSQLGARNWSLMHDLANRDSWIESFGVATWRDYERLMARRNRESALLRDQVRELQLDGKAPMVRVLLTATRSQPQAEPMLRA
ncbi:MAG: MFS transporter [Paracoccus sp. (in: a-proteobacteria)]